MAPTHGMLSHLRFHRHPSSQALDQPSPAPQYSQQQSAPTSNGALSADRQTAPSAPSSQPLVLPQMPSVDLELLQNQDERLSAIDCPSTQASPSSYNTMSGFIGGVAFRKHRRDASAPPPRGEASEDFSTTREPRPTSFQQETPMKPLSRILTSSKSTSLLNISAAKRNSSTTSLRPSNHQLPNDPLPPLPSPPPHPPPSQPLLLPTSSNVTMAEPKRGRKGLPFLRNPMSTLLLRRKAIQSAKNHLALPLGGRADEPTYDPRIKGTRVHDFSAPRRKSNVPAAYIPTTLSTTQLNNLAIDTRIHHSHGSASPDLRRGTTRQYSNASDSSGLRPGSTTTPHPILRSSSVSTIGTQSSLIEHPIPTGKAGSAPSIPPDDGVLLPIRVSSSRGEGTRDDEADAISRATGSVRTTRSRNLSLSSIPRHMKSTSSRFSFDMIGSANQEKLLEERHRQREMDKQAAAADAPRGSLYDDFDEDGFDYDAMMEDDGLEERIPGINADYDEEDFYGQDPADPDDDQENFAGFVFQRSNPGSSAVRSPRDRESSIEHMDALGQGFDGPSRPDATPPDSDSQPFFGLPDMEITVAMDEALGSHAHDAAANASDAPPIDGGAASASAPQQIAVGRGFTDDDLYFGGDFAAFESDFAEDLAAEPEGDGVPFDESIFDDNDTDQFGRPLPGAFALAQSLRRAAHQQSTKRPSFMASKSARQSSFDEAHDQASSGTDGAQLPVSGQRKLEDSAVEATAKEDGDGARGEHGNEGMDDGAGDASPARDAELVPSVPMSAGESVEAVYQAALAAAAQEAAASGKFERSAFPSYGGADGDTSEAPEDLELLGYDYPDLSGDDGYVDDGIGDDYELDDDAIIAEANASALASDADGWYGQEFGFYSAPINIHGSQNANADYNYANGGFFGPKGLNGLDRSASGRVASREPNLTPITERSEYSNRNSLMSLNVPHGSSGTPTMQSPGLAQLAMVSDRGEDMTLSALMRLRSRAWGDSQASLVSSKEGSPRSERGEAAQSSPRASWIAGTQLAQGGSGAHRRKSSVFSVVSRDSDAVSAPASPGLRLAIPLLPSLTAEAEVEAESQAQGKAQEAGAGAVGEVAQGDGGTSGDLNATCCASPAGLWDAPAIVAQRDGAEASASPCGYRASANAAELTPDGGSPAVSFAPRRHKRQKGSADSISYTQEEESGETRWVMERRRTGDCGQVEIVEREVVEGGRI